MTWDANVFLSFRKFRPTFKTATPTSRTQLKQQLQREQLQELERQENERRENERKLSSAAETQKQGSGTLGQTSYGYSSASLSSASYSGSGSISHSPNPEAPTQSAALKVPLRGVDLPPQVLKVVSPSNFNALIADDESMN